MKQIHYYGETLEKGVSVQALVRNTFFTCLPPMKISDIADYQIVKGVIGHKVHFNFKDRKIHFKVRVTNVENLREVLDGLNIIELSR